MSGWAAIGNVLGSVIGGGTQFLSDKYHNRRAQENAEKMAQNSIQWRAEDAKAAGIHPLYAMGASTAPSSHQTSNQLGSTVASGLSRAGQAIGRHKLDDLQKQSISGQVTQLDLQNTGLQIRNERALWEFDALKNANPDPVRDTPSIDGHDLKNPQRTTGVLKLLGYTFVIPKGMTDAQTWEDVTGEGGGFVSGVGNAVQMLGYNVVLDILKANNASQEVWDAVTKYGAKTYKGK